MILTALVDNELRGGVDDTLVLDLLRVQRPPPNWIVYRVLRYRAHKFKSGQVLTKECRHCPFSETSHYDPPRDLRILLLLVNGPLRHLTELTDDSLELSTSVRTWVSTLFNVADAAGARLDKWVAYDGRG